MNVTCEISSTNKFNSFNYSACNKTMADNNFELDFIYVNIISVLLSFPINSYVIWLIVRGTGNGLAAEISILNFSISEIFCSMQSLLIAFTIEFTSVWEPVDFLDGFAITGRPLFQSVICVERYLAVVHPVTFLKFKPLRYRLMCSAVAWITCFVSCIFNLIILLFLLFRLYFISYLAQFIFFLSIQMFCGVAVLRALKQSGPGERGREREEENLMKRRAFHLILITTVASFVMHAPEITLTFLEWNEHGIRHVGIFLCISYLCFLFAGLVQPLLFLYRVGKLNFMKCQ